MKSPRQTARSSRSPQRFVDRQALLDHAQPIIVVEWNVGVGIPALQLDVDGEGALHLGYGEPDLVDLAAGAHDAAIGIAALQHLAGRGPDVGLDVQILVGDAAIAPLGLKPVHEQLEPGERMDPDERAAARMPDQAALLEIVEPAAGIGRRGLIRDRKAERPGGAAPAVLPLAEDGAMHLVRPGR